MKWRRKFPRRSPWPPVASRGMSAAKRSFGSFEFAKWPNVCGQMRGPLWSLVASRGPPVVPRV
eukprot:7851563-Heterocapsa_arctica.AAC.1